MNQNIFSFCILLFITFMCSTSQAGYEVGNGGTVVICRDENLKITSVELLDVFEVREQIHLNRSDFEKKFYYPDKWISDLYLKSPRRSELYEKYIDNFDKEVFFYSDQIIPPTKDSGNINTLPYNCKVDQLIIQRSSVHPNDNQILENRYFVSSYYWNKLSPLNKAAAKLHEAIYRERIAQCISLKEAGCFPNSFKLTSEKIRSIVGLIITRKVHLLNKLEFDFLIKTAGFRGIEKNGILFIDQIPENLIFTKKEFDGNLIIDFTTAISPSEILSSSNSFEFVVNDYFHSSWQFENNSKFMTIKFGKYFIIIQQKNIFSIKDGLVNIKPIDNILGSPVYIFNSNNSEVTAFSAFNDIILSLLTSSIVINSKLKPYYFQ